METRQKQSIESYQRVQAFVADNPLPPPGSYGEPKTLLDDVVSRLTAHSNEQVTGVRLGKAARQTEQTLRKVLCEQHLRPINKIAGAVLRNVPGLDKALKMPRPQITTTRLIAVAGAFRAAATQHDQAFVRNGRAADFVAQLDAATEALRQAQLSKARNLGKSIGARNGMSAEIVRGNDAVQLLDAIVTTGFAGNKEVLGKWRSAKRIRAAAGGGGNGAVSVPTVSQAPTSAPAAAGTPTTEPKAA
jgi:hypothetical protein